MSTTLYWIQGGGCGGDTWSFLSAESPDLTELFNILSINVLWHPALSAIDPQKKAQLDRRILDDKVPLDILCVEGSVIQGPSGTGLADTLQGQTKKRNYRRPGFKGFLRDFRWDMCQFWRIWD